MKYCVDCAVECVKQILRIPCLGMTSAEVDSAVVATTKDTIEPQLLDSGNASVSGSPDCARTNGQCFSEQLSLTRNKYIVDCD